MREMKDSGVAWLGSIDSKFEVKEIGKLFSIRKEIIGKEPEQVLSITQKGIKIKDTSSNEGQNAASYSHYQIVNIGDFAMNHMDLLTGWVDISQYDGVTSPDYRVFVLFDKKQNPEYYLRVFQMYYTNRVFYAFGQGAANLGRWRLPKESFLKIDIPCPPLELQEKIANTIAKKVNFINKLIANQEAQIEQLKQYKQSLITEVVTKGLDPTAPTKDSGVEWIGEMPAHWKLIRFRFIAKITTGNSDTQDANPDGQYPFYVRSPIVERSDKYTFDGEGILMAGDGAGAGKVFHLVDGKYAVHQRVYRFYDFKYIDKQLLKHYLETLFSVVMDYGSAKTTVPSVRLPMIQDFPVCVPPAEEQAAILKQIIKQTVTINRYVDLLEKKIDKLVNYKKSLIYEYVTGKKEVH